MIISEQKYTNLNRKYYRGLLNYDKKNKVYNETYLSTRFAYAFAYSGLNGVVEIYELKQKSNIFNILSKVDEDNFRSYCRKNNNSKFLSYIDKLKNNDWKSVLGESDKNELINILKTLGYDGFFDYEIEKKIYNKLRGRACCPLSVLQINSPAVAVFDKEKSLKLVRVLDKKNFETFKEFNLMKKEEVEYVMSEITIFNEHISNEQIFLTLRNRIYTLTDKELKETIKAANTFENRKKQEEEVKKILEDWKTRVSRSC